MSNVHKHICELNLGHDSGMSAEKEVPPTSQVRKLRLTDTHLEHYPPQPSDCVSAPQDCRMPARKVSMHPSKAPCKGAQGRGEGRQ